MPDVLAAIKSIQSYQTARIALANTNPHPSNYDAQVISFRTSLLQELATAGFEGMEDAMSAIAAVHPPHCDSCYQCCIDGGCSNLVNLNGAYSCGHSGGKPDDCKSYLCQRAVEYNWPKESG